MLWGLKRKDKNVINVYCKKCRIDFDCDVGEIDFPIGKDMPEFEKAIMCKRCNSEYISGNGEFTDNFELSERGQSQLTSIFLK